MSARSFFLAAAAMATRESGMTTRRTMSGSIHVMRNVLRRSRQLLVAIAVLVLGVASVVHAAGDERPLPDSGSIAATSPAESGLDTARLGITVRFNTPPPVMDVAPPANTRDAALEMGGEQVPGGLGPTETIEYYGYDAIGSVRMVFDAAGNVVGQGTYTPFGQETWDAKGLPSQRFTGQERDVEAGSDYFNARSYQPRSGRFGSPDPLFGTVPENPQRWNRYTYALANPVSFTDRTGLVTEDEFFCEVVQCVFSTGVSVIGGDPGTRKRTPTPVNLSAGTGSPSSWRITTEGLFDVPDTVATTIPALAIPAIGAAIGEAATLAAQIAVGVAAVATAVDTGVKVAKRYMEEERTHVTYRLTNAETGKPYFGRASGYGTPQQVMMQRYASHEMRALGYGNPQLDRSAVGLEGYAAIRGREHLLIRVSGGPESGLIGNSANGIADYNPAKPWFINTAVRYWGIPTP